jgi:two-component system, cell cycle sensor histidine kinase and response regulator CckA
LINKKINVLIVEDLPSDAELAQSELMQIFQNSTFLVVYKEKNFIQALAGFKPDIIISDYQMPSFNGLAALKIAQKLSPFIPFIILTGSMNEDTAVVCMKSGADDYVIKEHIKRLGPAALNAIEKKKLELERHQTMEALRESEAKLSILYNNSPDMYASLSPPEANILQCNDTFLKYLGYSKEEVIGTSIFKMYHDDCLEEIKTAFQQFGTTGTIQDKELILRKKDGGKLDVSLNVKPVRDEAGEIIYAISSWRDISERKLAKKALEKSETQFETLVETLPDLIWFKDPNGIYLACNKRFEDFYGATQKEIIGKSDYDFVSKELADFFRANDQLAVKAGTPTVNEEELTFAVDGHKEILETTKTPMLNSDGDLIGVLGIGHDITERVQAEKEKEKLLHDNGERLKEMKLLYQVSKASIQIDKPLDGFLQNTVNNIPQAWQYPEIACARIIVDDKKFITTNFQQTKWSQSTDIKIHGKKTGSIEVFYLKKMPELYEGPFAKEERDLLDSLADHIRNLAERKQASEMLKKSEAQLKTLIETLPDLIWYKDPDGIYLACNKRFEDLYGAKQKEIINKSDYDFVSKELADFFRANDQLAVKAGTPTVNEEELTFAVDGHKEILETTKTPMFNSNGELIGVLGIGHDMTERVQAEKEIKKFKTISDNAVHGNAIADLQGAMIYVNNYMAHIHGYTVEELIGQSLSIFHTKKQLESVQQINKTLVKTGSYSPIEVGHVHKDGREFPMMMSGVVIRNVQDDAEYIAATAIDMSEIKHAEITLKKSEEKYRLLAINSIDVIWQMDLKLNFTYINPSVHKIFGYTPEEWMGSNLSQHSSRKEFIKMARHALKLRKNYKNTNYIIFESQMLKKNGEEIPIEIIGRLLLNERGLPVGLQGSTRDISERKQAEQALIQSATDYRGLFESAHDAYLIFSPENETVLEANQRACEMYGFKRSELIGMSLIKISKDINRGEKYIAKTLRDGSCADFETTHYRKDGTEFTLEAKATVVNYKGKQAILSIGRDITERKIVDEALRKSEKQNRSITQAAADAIISIDSDGIVLSWNKSAEKTFGYSSTEMINANLSKIIPTQYRVGHKNGIGRLANKGKEKLIGKLIEITAIRKNGTEFPIELSLSSWEENNQKYFTGIIRETTERKKINEELRKLNSAVEQSTSSIVITDLNGTIEYVNPCFCQLTGYSKEEALGQNPRLLKSGQTNPQSFVEMWETLSAGLEWRGEFINRKKNGDLFWEAVSISPIKDKKEEITHFLGIKQDITEQKKLQDQFRQSQKMEAVGKLAGGVAHDFNNLLTVINGYTDMLLAPLHHDDPSLKKLQQIKKSGKRAAALTNQLLAFSRKQVLKPEILDINGLLSDLEKMLKRLINENIYLETLYEHDSFSIEADAGQIEQIIINLAVNARDAMPNGGTLTIETQNIQLDETLVKQSESIPKGPYVSIIVSDTGIGMDRTTQSQIFEPFFTTKEEGRGTGLGLSTVYGIVKQSGGHIWVNSEPGKGTIFSIYFPAVKKSVDTAANEAETNGLVNGNETILLVEDEKEVRLLAELSLQSLGYHVITAIDGAEGLKKARLHQDIDLILTDVVMPNMSGRQMVDEIDDLHPNAKICYMTGYTDDALVHHGVLEKDVQLMQKPFSLNELAKKVRETLDVG